jgi:hypothetical protein
MKMGILTKREVLLKEQLVLPMAKNKRYSRINRND